ncbi:MAG TPA: alpha/beta fold hydrolase, partial [Nitrospiraceae bacterium]|nr:alpha/beta fold hydrolase [Nitrospiraceae bacterium]
MSNQAQSQLSGSSPFLGAIGREPFSPAWQSVIGRWSFSIKERRDRGRVEVAIPTTLQLNDDLWQGTTKSVGMHGLSVLFTGEIPAHLNQQIMMSFENDVGRLTLSGTVCGLRERAGESPACYESPGLMLAVQFQNPTQLDEQVLAAMLDGVRERSMEVRLVAKLISQETGDLILEATAPHASVVKGIHPGPADPDERSPNDRRFYPRVAASLRTEIRVTDAEGVALLPAATTINLTPGGACIVLSSDRDLRGARVLVRWPEVAPPIVSDEAQSVSESAGVLAGDVVWVNTATAQSGEQEMPLVTTSIGLRFLPGRSTSDAWLASLLVELAAGGTGSHIEPRTVRTDVHSCVRAPGVRIVLCHDYPMCQRVQSAPLVVLAPGYGETKREYVSMAYHLATNGFHVVRYDNVNHVGESDGIVTAFTLSDMEADLEAVLSYVWNTWPGRAVGLVATSLAGRVALKVAGRSNSLNLLILINSVMDVQATLQSVHREDLVGDYLAGQRKGVINILGLNIDADRWLSDAVQNGYADLESTIRDAARVRVPVVLFSAEHDAWVEPPSIEAVEDAIGPHVRHSYVVPEALHRLQENPRKARAVYRHIIASCQREMAASCGNLPIEDPVRREIGVQTRVERDRARARRALGKPAQVRFWEDYLQNFHYIANVSDFWRLMDHVYRLMGDCYRGECILDAGCGNGNFGVFLQINQAYRQRYARHRDFRAPSYVGLDFVPGALIQARKNLDQVRATLSRQFRNDPDVFSPMQTTVCRADLEWPLPFPDRHFDRVVCNLVVGYVRDPLFTLRECLRVLTPHG